MQLAVDLRLAAIFVGTPSVRDACETLIVEQGLSVDSIVPILEWALSEPHSDTGIEFGSSHAALASSAGKEGADDMNTSDDTTDWIIRQCFKCLAFSANA